MSGRPGWVAGLRWEAAARSAGLNARLRWLTTIREVPSGPAVLHLSLGHGTSQDDVAKSADLLAAAFKSARVEVVADRLRADRCSVILHRTHVPDPVMYPETFKVAPRRLPRSHLEPVPLGLDSVGNVVTVPLFDRNSGATSLLLSGVPGSGKSMGLRVVLAGLAPTATTIIVIDPTGGAEASLWTARLGEVVLSAEPQPTLELLHSVLSLIVRRGELLGAGAHLALLSPLVLVIDELAELAAAGTPKQQEEARSVLRRVVALGRKVNVGTVLASQRVTSTTVDVTTRSLVGWRLALAHPDDVHGSEALLGPGRKEAAKLTKADVGAGYLTNGGVPVLLRVFHLPTNDVAALSQSGVGMDLDSLHQWDEAALCELSR